jgi:hypothetical protein
LSVYVGILGIAGIKSLIASIKGVQEIIKAAAIDHITDLVQCHLLREDESHGEFQI